MKAVIAYVPVIHKAYLDFLLSQRADVIYVVDPATVQDIRSVKKDLRALAAGEALDALSAFALVRVFDEDAARFLVRSKADIVMPDDEVSRELASRYFSGHEVRLEPVFLRWDQNTSIKAHEVDPDEVVSAEVRDRDFMTRAINFSRQSVDWWRHVGAVLVVDKAPILAAYNQAVPHQDLPLYEGDPRGSFRQGVQIEVSLVLHAEAMLIAQAAKYGLRLEGSQLYVTTFPCPPCAKLVAYSGIETVYFAEGYAMLDGERILKDNGVRIVRVEM